MAKRKLGEILLDRRLVSAGDLEQAITQRSKDLRLGEELLRRGMVEKDELARTIAEVTGIAYLDCFTVQVEPNALALVPQALAERHCALPVKLSERRLTIIMAEPQDLAALDEIRFAAGVHLDPKLGFSGELRQAIARYYRGSEQKEDPLTGVLSTLSSEGSLDFVGGKTRRHKIDPEACAELQSEHTPAVRLVSAIIATAVQRHASDIHFDQALDSTAVRLRVDGVLHHLTDIPSSYRTSVVSRIKILADMDISERRVSQDGSFMVRVLGEALDLRVSTLPSQHGEKIVIRLLKANGPSAELRELGMSSEIVSELQAILRQPQGLLLVTGPTGCGKSTTLYTSLRMLRDRQMNITTVEDPIEYVQEGITQVQVNTRAGRTFANCLRSILRQDPNVILIGEIRDQETAEIALQAAQTGHLVLSTLHTADSFGSLGRLFDLGASRFLVAQSTTAVIAQRLVRKLCGCRRQVKPSLDYLEIWARTNQEEAAIDVLWEAVGCEQCSGSGYKGRVGVYELLKFTPATRHAVMRSASEDELRALAQAEGLQTMFAESLRLVREGITSFDEVLRVIPMQSAHNSACRACATVLPLTFRYCPQCGHRSEGVAAAEPSVSFRPGALSLAGRS